MDIAGLIALGFPKLAAAALGWSSSSAVVSSAGTPVYDKIIYTTGQTSAGSEGVVLPHLEIGEMMLVVNNDNNYTIRIKPESTTHTINDGTAGAYVVIAAARVVLIVKRTETDVIALEIPRA